MGVRNNGLLQINKTNGDLLVELVDGQLNTQTTDILINW